MDDEFLEVYEDAAQGRVDQARARLASLPRNADPQRVAEMAAFLDSLDDEADPVPSTGVPTDLTHPGRDLWNPPARDAVPFHCLSCGHDEHVRRTVLLNRRFTTFFGFDMVDRGALTYACVRCGRIVWFGRAAPGFVQAWRAGDERLALVGEGESPCAMCGFRGLDASKALLNTRFLALLGLDWLDEGAHVERCLRCGLLHWWGGKAGPEASADEARPDRCGTCGGSHLYAHRALLNSRVATTLGLDWLDRPAWVLRCGDCRSITWWSRRPQAVTE